jgi:hypothetical protein
MPTPRLVIVARAVVVPVWWRRRIRYTDRARVQDPHYAPIARHRGTGSC